MPEALSLKSSGVRAATVSERPESGASYPFPDSRIAGARHAFGNPGRFRGRGDSRRFLPSQVRIRRLGEFLEKRRRLLPVIRNRAEGESQTRARQGDIEQSALFLDVEIACQQRPFPQLVRQGDERLAIADRKRVPHQMEQIDVFELQALRGMDRHELDLLRSGGR